MPDWLPSLNALRAFEAVARHLSYTEAARELGVTAAAVKQLVTKLEESVGHPLVHRVGNGLAIDQSAQSAVVDFAQGMNALKAGVSKLRDPERSDQLVISCESSFASAWLVPNLASYRKANPDVRIFVESTHRLVDLTAGEADVAIRYAAESPGLRVTRLIQDEIYPVCSSSLWPGAPQSAPLETLLSWPLIHSDISRLPWAVNSRANFDWAHWARQFGLVLDPNQCENAGSFEDYDHTIQTAVAGLGVILASGPLLGDLLERGLLVRPFKEVLKPGLGFDVVTSEQAFSRPDVEKFVDWIVASFK